MDKPSLREIATRIDRCADCGTPLPLCEANDPADARPWMCVGCGKVYSAMLWPKYEPATLRNLRPELFEFDDTELEDPPEEIADFIRTHTIQTLESVEKRAALRHPVIAVLPVLPLNSLLQAAGPPFKVTTRDISTRGIGMIYTRPFTDPFLAVELQMAIGQSTQVIAQVLRCRPRGPYFDIAGEFITKAVTLETTTPETTTPEETAPEETAPEDEASAGSVEPLAPESEAAAEERMAEETATPEETPEEAVASEDR